MRQPPSPSPNFHTTSDKRRQQKHKNKYQLYIRIETVRFAGQLKEASIGTSLRILSKGIGGMVMIMMSFVMLMLMRMRMRVVMMMMMITRQMLSVARLSGLCASWQLTQQSISSSTSLSSLPLLA